MGNLQSSLMEDEPDDAPGLPEFAGRIRVLAVEARLDGRGVGRCRGDDFAESLVY